MMVALEQNTKKLNALASFRFIAAFFILWDHSRAYFNIWDVTKVFQLTQGVSFFFVLSGFVLAYNYNTNDRRPWRRFYQARFARIWPAHIAALALHFALVENSFGLATNWVTRTATLVANIFLVQSWIPMEGFFFSYNGVAWSLSTELGFYILFPVLIAHRAKKLPWGTLAVCLALTGFFVGLGAFEKLTLFGQPFGPSLLGIVLANPLSRLFEFSLGIFACSLYRRLDHGKNYPWAVLECGGIGVVGFSMYLCTESHVNSLIPAVANYLLWAGSALPYFILILIFACSTGPITRAISCAPLVFLGEISFCLYLVHQTILECILQWHLVPANSILALLGYWVVSLLLACLMHVAIERPARTWIVSWKLQFLLGSRAG